MEIHDNDDNNPIIVIGLKEDVLSSLTNRHKHKHGFNNQFCNIFTKNPKVLPNLEILSNVIYATNSMELIRGTFKAAM